MAPKNAVPGIQLLWWLSLSARGRSKQVLLLAHLSPLPRWHRVAVGFLDLSLEADIVRSLQSFVNRFYGRKGIAHLANQL